MTEFAKLPYGVSADDGSFASPRALDDAVLMHLRNVTGPDIREIAADATAGSECADAHDPAPGSLLGDEVLAALAQRERRESGSRRDTRATRRPIAELPAYNPYPRPWRRRQL